MTSRTKRSRSCTRNERPCGSHDTTSSCDDGASSNDRCRETGKNSSRIDFSNNDSSNDDSSHKRRKGVLRSAALFASHKQRKGWERWTALLLPLLLALLRRRIRLVVVPNRPCRCRQFRCRRCCRFRCRQGPARSPAPLVLFGHPPRQHSIHLLRYPKQGPTVGLTLVPMIV